MEHLRFMIYDLGFGTAETWGARLELQAVSGVKLWWGCGLACNLL